MNNQFSPRIGAFFLLIGLLLMFLFLGSVLAKETNFNYFFLGLAALVLGFLFRRRTTPPPPSGRFSAIRKANERTRQVREAREKKKTEKK